MKDSRLEIERDAILKRKKI